MKPQVVGRDPELAALTRAVRDTLAGHGRMMLLRGDAGIGKSTLAEHAIDLAREQGMSIVHGRAHPLLEGLAYAPIVEAIRPHVDPGESPLTQLLADTRTAGPNAPELERTRMFEAVTALVESLAPAVVFIDDLHWADQGTIELFSYLGHAVSDRRLLVLAAYRAGEETGPLGELVSQVRRRDPDAELTIGPLADDAVAQLAENLLRSRPKREFLNSVTERAKGIPLFVTALVHDGYETEWAVPTIVRDVVMSRLSVLSEAERKQFELIAVAGDAATSDVLPIDEPTALRKLIGRGLVTEHAAGRSITYRSTHPLYAEVAYADLTLGERRALHAAVLTAIEKTRPDDVLTLAPHYREAGQLVDAKRAVQIMADAGWRALSISATDEAVRYLRGAADQAGPDEAPILLDGVGRAYLSHGDCDLADQAWAEGQQIAARHGNVKQVRLLRLRRAVLAAERQDSATASELVRIDVESEPITADTAFYHFVFTMRYTGHDELRAALEQLAELADPRRSDADQAVGHMGKSVQLMLDHAFVSATREAETAIRHARRCETQAPFFGQFFSLITSGLAALNGDIAKAVSLATETQRTARPIDLPSARCYEQYAISFAHYLGGDIDAAMTAAEKGVAIARRSQMPRALSRMASLRAFLLAEQGKLRAAAADLAEADQVYSAPEDRRVEVVAMAAAAVSAHTGDPVPARSVEQFMILHDPCAVVVQRLFAGLWAVRSGNAEILDRCLFALRDTTEDVPLMSALADRLEGLRTKNAELIADSADRLRAMGASLFAAQARLEWAELTADREVVTELLEYFAAVGTKPWLDRAKLHARSVGARIRSVRIRGPLSDREQQVVALLGDGLSNADIAARLFVSERTVETHLRNSYAKLGLSSRIALAQWANENRANEYSG